MAHERPPPGGQRGKSRSESSAVAARLSADDGNRSIIKKPGARSEAQRALATPVEDASQ
jgi:hypothetical protein